MPRFPYQRVKLYDDEADLGGASTWGWSVIGKDGVPIESAGTKAQMDRGFEAWDRASPGAENELKAFLDSGMGTASSILMAHVGAGKDTSKIDRFEYWLMPPRPPAPKEGGTEPPPPPPASGGGGGGMAATPSSGAGYVQAGGPTYRTGLGQSQSTSNAALAGLRRARRLY